MSSQSLTVDAQPETTCDKHNPYAGHLNIRRTELTSINYNRESLKPNKVSEICTLIQTRVLQNDTGPCIAVRAHINLGKYLNPNFELKISYIKQN